MELEHVVVNKNQQVATVTLNRPKVLNALSARTIDELDAVFEDLASDDGIRVIVLTGAGEKAFAAGAEIAQLAEKAAVPGLDR
ncbi:MAG: enoyl-CoA hydratase-related protein, partial [Candidatus Latescibacterota bacterium]